MGGVSIPLSGTQRLTQAPLQFPSTLWDLLADASGRGEQAAPALNEFAFSKSSSCRDACSREPIGAREAFART